MYACPKHVCTDHPVLVYKTCEIEWTVLRLFSCLSLTIEHLSLYLAVFLLNISLLILWICHGQVTVSFNYLGSGAFWQGYFLNRKSTQRLNLGSHPNVVVVSVFQRGKAGVRCWALGSVTWDVMWLVGESRKIMWYVTWLIWEQVKITQVDATWNQARYDTRSRRRLEMRSE